MNYEALIGCAVSALALGIITGLVLWSRRTMNLIRKKNLGSARAIVHELNKNGKRT